MHAPKRPTEEKINLHKIRHGEQLVKMATSITLGLDTQNNDIVYIVTKRHDQFGANVNKQKVITVASK